MTRKRGLGRGLDALLGEVSDSGSRPAQELMSELALESIQRGRHQPRMEMREEALQELTNSIKAQGVMQPIVVRRAATQGPNPRYEIIAGERRWRAAQRAGLTTIPAIVREASDEVAVALGLVENIQREDLNPIEEGAALQRLQDEFHLTQQQVADAVGKSRVAVTNLLRLLNLSPEARSLLERGELEMGHARALLGLDADRQYDAAKQVVRQGLSVRQTEAMVRRMQRPETRALRREDPDTRRLERELAEKLGAEVQIRHTAKGKGRMVIRYASLEELDGILRRIT
ncbi:MAG: ParB/RepB/Spo0J family partition protein [Gammaproteobacteria bacterium]|nr:ParB/RepB/Spo0J family partition protein [Gammaproteobacteria bacterium]